MKVTEGLSRDLLRLFVWYPLRWLVLILPMNLSFDLLKLMGKLHFYLSRAKRKLLTENLILLRGLQSGNSLQEDIIRRYFENHYVDRLHIFLYPRFNGKTVDKHFPIEGLDILDNELSKNRGCILLQGHFGPIQIPLFALALKGYSIKQIGHLTMPEDLSYVGKKTSYRLREKYESMIPAEIISARTFLKKAYEFLKDSNLIMMTGDGAAFGQFIGKHVPVHFLSQKILFPVGWYNIARRTKSSVLPLFIVREKNSRFRIVIEKALDIDYNNAPDDDLIGNVEKFAEVFEKYVAKYPCHWHLVDELDVRLAG